jgi:hypothetical protein
MRAGPVAPAPAPVAPPPGGGVGAATADAALLANITNPGNPFTTAMAPVGAGRNPVTRTMDAWQALAGEITNLVIGPGGLPNRAEAGVLLTVFSEINQYCNNQLYGGGGGATLASLSPLAQHLLGGTPGSAALPGIELFAKQATQVLGAIAHDTGAPEDILTVGFSLPDPGWGDQIVSDLLQGTTGSPNLDVSNLHSAILKTLLTPHRQIGLDSCAIDSTIISETINHPARMAGMYKGLLIVGAIFTPTNTVVVNQQQFDPFLNHDFAGRRVNFPMTNLDSMLVHSLACMLYENNDVSSQPAAYELAANMPEKYLGTRQPAEIFNVDTTWRAFAIDVCRFLTCRTVRPTGSDLAQTVSRLAGNRPYIPTRFLLTNFDHGQNFIVAASPNNLVIDTNWIDPSTGCPIYWKIDTTAGRTMRCEPSIVSDMAFSPCPGDGGRTFLVLGAYLPSGQIYLMPNV